MDKKEYWYNKYEQEKEKEEKIQQEMYQLKQRLKVVNSNRQKYKEQYLSLVTNNIIMGNNEEKKTENIQDPVARLLNKSKKTIIRQREHNSELQTKIQEQEDELLHLKQELKKFTVENEKLQSSNRKLEKTVKKYKKQEKRFRKQVQRLQDELDDLWDKYQKTIQDQQWFSKMMLEKDPAHKTPKDNIFRKLLEEE